MTSSTAGTLKTRPGSACRLWDLPSAMRKFGRFGTGPILITRLWALSRTSDSCRTTSRIMERRPRPTLSWLRRTSNGTEHERSANRAGHEILAEIQERAIDQLQGYQLLCKAASIPMAAHSSRLPDYCFAHLSRWRNNAVDHEWRGIYPLGVVLAIQNPR